MRTLPRFLLVLLLSAKLFSAPNSLLIYPKGVGPIRLGMTIEEARKAAPTWKFLETIDDEEAPCIDVRSDNKVILRFFMYSYRFGSKKRGPEIAEIVVLSPMFSTTDGIRYGTLLSEIEKHWGKFLSAVRSDNRAVQFANFQNQPKWLWVSINGSVIKNPNQKSINSYPSGTRIGYIVIGV